MEQIEKELRIAGLLAKKHSGAEMSPEEVDALDQWAARSDANRRFCDQCVEELSMGEYARITAMHDTRRGWRSLEQTIGIRRRPRRWLRVSVSVAAVSVVAALCTLFLSRVAPAESAQIVAGSPKAVMSILQPDADEHISFSLGETEQETGWQKYVEESREELPQAESADIRITVPRGGEYKLILDDGTAVWINSETTLEYPAKFDSQERHVKLSGEAFFEVAKDSGHPFIVTTAAQTITVTGTSFNISAYAADNHTYTTLVSGSVVVASGSDSAELRPGMQAVTSLSATGIETREVNTDLYTSWVDGVFEFENIELREICSRLERWYDVEFVFEGGSADERFTGGTWRHMPLNDFLTSIEMVTDVTFNIGKDQITVTKKR